MTLKQLNIKREYRPDDNIVKSFYIPLLQLAQTYDRAVGFFSSTILAEIAIGIQEIARKDGRIRIVASQIVSILMFGIFSLMKILRPI